MVNEKIVLFWVSIVTFVVYKIILNLFLPEISLVNFDYFFVTVIICLVSFQSIVLKYSKIKIFSFISMFLFFSYLFNAGQVFTNFFGGDFIWKAQDVLTIYGYSLYKDSVIIALDSIYFVFLGILFCNMFQHNEMKETMGGSDRLLGFTWTRKDLLTLGIVIVCVSLPFNLYIFVVRLIGYLTTGYSEMATISINNLVLYISNMFLAGSILIVGMSRQKNKKNLYLMFTCFFILSMATGLRAYNIVNILVLSYVFIFRCHNFKINKLHLVYIVIAFAFITNLLISIRDMRLMGLNIIDLPELMLETFEKGMFLDLLTEFSASQSVLAITINSISEQQFLRGLSVSFLSVIPGVSMIFQDIDFDAYTLDKALGLRALGGSYIADFYFDDIVYMGSFLLGILVCFLFSVIEKNNSILRIAMFSPLAVDVFLCIRSSIAKLPRFFVWYLLIFLGIYYIAGFLLKKNKSRAIIDNNFHYANEGKI